MPRRGGSYGYYDDYFPPRSQPLEAKGGSEVEAALGLIGLIDLKGHIVTADALHCHRRMAAAVTAKGGDYCFALKGNQEGLLSDARACLSKANTRHPTAKSETRGHGREETRVGIVVKPARADEILKMVASLLPA
jgi:predicted transposase YbfD/YdcC